MAAYKCKEITCTPCGRTGRPTKPVKFCLECDEYYCSSCLPYHGKFLSTKDHTVDDVSGSDAEFPCTIELATSTDVQTPDKARLVRLVSGSFLVCDWYNKALKMLDGNYTVVDEVSFTDYPHTVCVFNENEVAVSLRDKKEIVFVTLDKGLRLSNRQPVKTGGACRGMAFVNGDLYVATGGGKKEGPGQVEVYSLSGRRIIDTDAGGNRLFGAPITFAVNPTGSEINITDYKQGIVTINPQGAVLRRLSYPVLQGAHGICMDDGGNLFVASYTSQHVVKIEQNGSMKVIHSESDGVVKPVSLCFDPEKRCLLVGMEAKKPLVAFKLNE